MATADPRVTVRAALDLPVLRRGLPEVLAGRPQLDREIRWVHAGEVPNIASLLVGGELLLTTGMGLGEGAEVQRAFVDRLADRNVAALVVERGAVLPELPAPVVEAAERRELPLIALRREVPFVAVTEAIHTELVSGRLALLHRADDVQRRLAGVLLDGGGVPGVLAALSAAVGNPVYLEDADGRLLLHAGAGADARGGADALAAWQAARPTTADDRWEQAVVAPVPAGSGARPGRLVALGLTAPLGPDAQLAVQRAADVVALGLLRSRQEDELVAHERGSVLLDLVAGRAGAREAAAQARAVGFAPAGDRLLPVAAELPPGTPTATASLVAHDAQGDLRRRGHDALIGAAPGPAGLLGVVALRGDDERATAADAFAAAARAALERRGTPPEATTVVAGTPTGWEGAGDALRLAAEGAASAGRLPTAPWHDVRALELQRLLWRWRSEPDLAEFADRVLGPLIAHDATRRPALLPTLEALCASGGQKAQAARRLHLNRQALYHRLDRIEELLGVDLADPEQLLTLHLAIRAHRVVGG